MRFAALTIRLSAVLTLAGTQTFAQNPATVPYTNEIGFTYNLPADWEVLEQRPSSVAQPVATPLGILPIPDESKGPGCVQVGLTARHGTPASAIVAVMLPFSCFGQTMSVADLPGFGEGIAEGLKDTFDVTASANSTYSLDSHRVWIERAIGTAKGQTNPLQSTLEIACTILNKGAVCWMVTAVDSAALGTFENSKIVLDGGPAHPLVPPEDAARVTTLAGHSK